MYKILLCCTSGFTTSMLVNKMKEEANQKKVDVMVWAVAASAVELSWADADCVLVAPQNKSDFEKVQTVVNGVVPVGMIDKTDFTEMNGSVLLQQAMSMIDAR